MPPLTFPPAVLAGFTALVWLWAIGGAALFLLVSLGGLAIVGWLLVRLPARYFTAGHSRDFWIDRHPVLRWSGVLLKNLLGALLVGLGVVLAMPGVPGPGLLTILIGVMLLDFPGKRRFELWLLRRPRIHQAIDRLRARWGKPPLELDGPELPARGARPE
jgi:hypothetical protein